jgi:flagella basal body P-ring formation protein FlgA
MSRFATILAFLPVVAGTGAIGALSNAAEMRMRTECRPQHAIVTLGDLVDLRCDSTSEAERLARIALFPAPAAGLRRFVSVREIQDMLLIRGIDLIDHEFRGPASVLVVGREPQQKPTTNVRLSSASPRLADQKLRKALNEYLLRSADEPWQIDFQLDEETARWIAAAQSLTVRADGAPSSGRRCFEITLQVGDAVKTVDVVAEVSLPPLVVVPVRSIPRDTRIDRADLELRRLDDSTVTAGCAQRIEDLVGKEATRSLAAGKPIPRSSVCEPVLVRRGEIVTVVVRTAGIRVRTQARARDDGAQGELVAVESLTDRRTYFAQVSGIREVEVLAAPVSAEQTPRTTSSQG